jgi:hypothetical protein
MRSLTQLMPSIPLRTPKGGGEAIAVIDYGPEADLVWVVIDDATGEVWGHPNRDVRGFPNYSLGAPRKGSPVPDASRLLEAFITQYLAQPGETERFLQTCIDRQSFMAALAMIADNAGKPMPKGAPDWMPDFGLNQQGGGP